MTYASVIRKDSVLSSHFLEVLNNCILGKGAIIHNIVEIGGMLIHGTGVKLGEGVTIKMQYVPIFFMIGVWFDNNNNAQQTISVRPIFLLFLVQLERAR